MRQLAKKIAGVVIVGMMAMGIVSLKVQKLWAHGAGVGVSTTAVVDVLVTPIVTVDLTASPTFYNFGLLDVNSSSFSASAITLDNTGNVGVSMQKHGNNAESGNWTIGTSSGLNIFRLYAATATDRPTAFADFTDAEDRMTTSLNNLEGIGGATQVLMDVAETVDLWFRIDMPTATTFGSQQSIPVHFVGSAQ